jgi:transposase
MRNQRRFSLEFKRHVVEELISEVSRPAQLCRRHDIAPSLLYHWKRQYSRGKFNNEPTEEGALKDRVEKLERLVGKFTLENELLKRGFSTASASVRETTDHQGMGMPRCRHPMGMSGDEAFKKQLLSQA